VIRVRTALGELAVLVEHPGVRCAVSIGVLPMRGLRSPPGSVLRAIGAVGVVVEDLAGLLPPLSKTQ
jgi:hypothetical protein